MPHLEANSEANTKEMMMGSLASPSRQHRKCKGLLRDQQCNHLPYTDRSFVIGLCHKDFERLNLSTLAEIRFWREQTPHVFL
jgi:hypothetical protein